LVAELIGQIEMSIDALSNYTLSDCRRVTGGRFESINPANREIIAAMAAADEKDVDAAVASAKKAFRDGSWSGMAPRERMQVLYRYAQLIEANAEQLAVLDTLDMGKPISDMLDIDIPSVVETVQFMAEYIDKMEGSVTNTEAGVMHFILREPISVVALV